MTFCGAKKRKLIKGECSDSEEPLRPADCSLPTRSEAKSEPNDETETALCRRAQQVHDEKRESDLRRRVQGVHCAMKQYWNQSYYADRDPKVLHHLSLLLFMKRRCAQPAGEDSAGAPHPSSDSDTAFASQAETARGILSALQVRRDFLENKNLADLRHVLTERNW